VHLPELDDFRRPQWRSSVPALWRDAQTVQLGDDVVVDRLTAKQHSWMTTLDGSRTSEQVAESLPIPAIDARRLLRAMLAAGALVDAGRTPATLRFGRPEAREAAQRIFETAIDITGNAVTALAVMEARDRARVGITGSGHLRDAVAHALDAAGLIEVATPERATIAVLTDAPHPDVPARYDGEALDRPHLHVGVRAHRAVIGPLVVPGRTSCLRCAHLHRRDADPSWPLVAVQWSQADGGAARADPLIVTLAAAHAVHAVRSWVDNPHADWVDTALDLRLGNTTPTKVSRPPHPLCGCLWGTT